MADDDGYDPDEYPRHPVRRLLTRAVALVLIVGLVLAFPLGYLLDAELRNQHLEAVLLIVEVVVVAVLFAAVRASRRL
jgi:uncharacterized membrane protein